MVLITGYFALNPGDRDGYKTKIISTDLFKVQKDKDKKVIEVNGKTDVELDPVILLDENGVEIGTEETILPELVIPGRALGLTTSGKEIVHAVIEDWVSEKTKKYIESVSPDVEDFDPFEDGNQEILGIKGKFIGNTRADVFAKYPEMLEQYQDGVDENNDPFMWDRLKMHTWKR